MGFDRRRRASAVLNLTPLIDIVFLLLVFFMLTSHFIEDQVLDIDLPEARRGSESVGKEVVEVIVGADGVLRFEGREVHPQQLEETLRGALHAPGTKRIRLRGDRQADLGLVVAVIDAARAAGADSLDILTRKP